MLPNFNAANAGAFVYDNIQLNEKWLLNAGIRYDLGFLQTEAYYDWYKTPQADGSLAYMQRASALNRSYGNLSWGTGLSRKTKSSTLKINAGKSFRMPTAKETASNGINYHMYRFEKGDSTLKAEESYQLDFAYELTKSKWQLGISPFVNYFPNYIYLNPTASYYEAQQIYFYSQSAVFRTGGEIAVRYDVTKKMQVSLDAEYIYSLQLSGLKKGYTLPFSPPLNANIEISYKPENKGVFSNTEIGALLKLTAAQNSIVPPEKKTSGFAIWNLSAATEVLIGKQALKFNMQLNNILNTRYHDHTSFYRLIEVPGQGRNLVMTIQIPFL